MEIVYDLGNCYTVFDEADLYFTQDNDFLQTFLVTIRNRLSGGIVICKRPFVITKDSRNLLNKIMCFRIRQPDEIRYLASITGQPADQLQVLLPYLQPGQHVVFDLDTNEMSPVIRYALPGA